MSIGATQVSSDFFAQDHKIIVFPTGRRLKPLNVGFRTNFSAGRVLKARLKVHGTLSIQSHPSSKESSTSTINTIKKLFQGVDDASGFSAYDMGWIARIPHAHKPELGPHFPRSLEWIVCNQCEDGSWDQGEEDAQRVCSTLSCVTALKTWNREECSIQRGVSFLKSQLPLVHDKLSKDMEVILHRLLQEAQSVDLELNYDESYVQHIYEHGQEFLQRVSNDALEQYPTSFVHILEAFHHRPNWQDLLRYQSRTGCLFSVTLTACAYMHTGDTECHRFLNGVLDGQLTKPNENRKSCQLAQLLRLVDWLEHLGIERHFEKEIEQTVIQAFRYWRGNAAGSGSQQHLQSFEESALLFRILRRHGYEVSPDMLLQRPFCETHDLKELSLASHFFFPNERKKMLDSTAFIDVVNEETTFPWYDVMHRIQHIECMTSMDSISISERASILAFAKSDFNACQKVYQKDLQHVLRWSEDCDFGRLRYARREVFCYFSGAATMFQPEHSMARIVWAKMGFLTAIIDDFFDMHDSLDNLRNFCAAVKRWDPSGLELSEEASILFQALAKTVKWAAQCALVVQGGDISSCLRAQWQRLCDAYFREAEWRLTNHCPSLEEYIENGITSIALEPIMLSTIFFLNEKVDPSVLNHPDCIDMFRRTSRFGRLLNDIRGFDRESSGGEFTWITIYMKEHPGASMEEVVAEMRTIIKAVVEELVEDVLRPRAVPKRCKRVFESMMRIVNFVYREDEGFKTDRLRGHIEKVLHTTLD